MANKQATVNCYDLTFDGKGVVKYQDKIGFIDNLLSEEEALIEITYEKKDSFFGKVISFLLSILISPLKHLISCLSH